MSDNPQYGASRPFALHALRVLQLSGRDALAFAQAQFMNDVTSLADGDWQWSGWLDPKGRVQALFALLRIDAETAWVVTAADAETLAASLRRFVFRSKVKIEDASVHASGVFMSPQSATGGRSARTGDAIELDLSGDAGGRTLVLAPSPGAAPTIDEEAAWWHLDIAHGWPGLPGTALDHWTPQQLSLQRFDAFSVKKGCYPGQEIVARTHFLGRAKRGLARLRVGGDASAGDALTDAEGRDVGQVVVVRSDEALAVVPLEPADAVLRLRDGAVERLALADGLKR
ncbi:folate-binding protein [Lysobacter sp. TY2-98]|uniref:CAF17-like 4Fe-4S cluster assembly/insertion protein YgfZ n=1 Tax=Lysobacter sp. TY2-98 TaxID=2290922 RepID=UPI000E205785|nr:folate-binding protein YgfZ [Lysobacter sp. TY2-98]AXK71624.1 folate-binding protein [Lysobacter sp. TY2-98]